MRLIPVILCGGAGARLWPISRDLHPKPFIRLADQQSLLQKAFLRASHLNNIEEVCVVTNQKFFFKVDEELQIINENNLFLSYILEPFGKDTAPAITTAAFHLNERYGDDALMLVLPADHMITDQNAFRQTVTKAVELAKNNKLVTFGIKPEAPETSYGYIETNHGEVLRFVEKPCREKAEAYFNSGCYFWNSGMFCFNTSTLLEEMNKHRPEMVDVIKRCWASSKLTRASKHLRCDLNPTLFEEVHSDSIDYALMERSTQVAVVPCSIGWSDVGSWSALSNLIKPDQNDNRIEGKVLLHASNNCYIKTQDRTVSAIGVDNLIIVDTPDALLVANKENAQDVKEIYTRLKQENNDVYRYHRTVYRPWGHYTVLEESEGFKIKRIEVKPGASLSLQMHLHRNEHWIIVSGHAKVTNNDKIFLLNENESTYISATHKHRLENITAEPVIFIEVQTGHYLGEDDIVRYKDNYGRIECPS